MARATVHLKIHLQQSGHRIVRAVFALQPTCAPGGMLTVIHGKEFHVMKLTAQQIAFIVTQHLTSLESPKPLVQLFF
jgi:hypothetical protein